jgi:Arm DNA-binding domain
MIAVNSQRGRHRDGGGLYFVVGSKGECRWAFLYKSRTDKLASGLPKPIELGLGGAPDGSDKPAVSLADARRKAAELRALLVK